MEQSAQFNGWAERLQQGDSKAGEQLFDHFFPQVYRFLLARLGHRETAQDLAQDVFLKLVKNIKSFDAKQGNFTPWLWQITRNTLIDFFRQKKPQYLDDVEGSGEYIPDPSDITGNNARLREVMNIVQTLSPEDQELFQLHFITDMSYPDMAAIMDKSEANLRVAIHRVRQKILKHA